MDTVLPKIASFEEFKKAYPTIWHLALGLSESYAPTSFWVTAPVDGAVDGNNVVNGENWWRCREARRFFDGQYCVPYFLHALHKLPHEMRSRYEHHFLHMSTDFPEMVSFTPNAEYGKADRQVAMKVGRYLTKFYSDAFSAEKIRDIANNGKDLDIQWAYGSDITDIYLAGPESCMSHPVEEYSTDGIHPTEVYGYRYPVEYANDGVRTAESDAYEFGLAYMSRSEDIVARALVAMRHKVYVRCYGDEHMILAARLEDAGFKHTSSMGDYGLRLKRLRCDGEFICPYLDGADQEINDEGTYLVWTSDGEYMADRTDGQASKKECDRPHCDHCDNAIQDEDDEHYVESEDCTVCGYCYNEHYVEAYYGAHNNTRTVDRDRTIYIDSTDEYFVDELRILEYHNIVQCGDGDYREKDDCLCDVDGTWHEQDDDRFIRCNDDEDDERYDERDNITNDWRGRWLGTSSYNEFAGEFAWFHPDHMPSDVTLVSFVVDDFGNELKFLHPNPEYMSPGQAAFGCSEYAVVDSIDNLCSHLDCLRDEYERQLVKEHEPQLVKLTSTMEAKAVSPEKIDLDVCVDLLVTSSYTRHEENRA